MSIVFLLELWGVSRAQDPLLLLTPSCKLSLLPCVPRHPPGPVQTGAGLHHLGLQTHHEECGWHWWAGLFYVCVCVSQVGDDRQKANTAGLLQSSSTCEEVWAERRVGGWWCSSVSAHAGLQILYTLLQNVAQEEAAAQSFYQTYFCDILQHIFSVVTDTSHTAGEFPHRRGV